MAMTKPGSRSLCGNFRSECQQIIEEPYIGTLAPGVSGWNEGLWVKVCRSCLE